MPGLGLAEGIALRELTPGRLGEGLQARRFLLSENPTMQQSTVAAIRSRDNDTLAQVLDKGADVDEYDANGAAPLFHAVHTDNGVAVDLLLQYGANPLRLNALCTDSPFFAAVRRRNASITHLLLKAGRRRAGPIARTSWIGHFNDLLTSPDASRLVSCLEAGLDPNTAAPGLPTLTLLSFFLEKRDAFAASTVIQWGCDVSRLLDASGGWEWPALHIAADKSLADVAWLLLQDGADPSRLEQKWSALFLAARSPFPAVAELLLDAGADVNVGLGMETPLMNASSHGHVEVMNLLLARGADPNRQDSQGATALHYAAAYGHHASVKVLLESGAEANVLDNSGSTAADRASNEIDPVFAQLYRDWGMSDRYSAEPEDDDWTPRGNFHYFLSYRHGRFAALASELADHLTRRGLKVFIDQVELNITEASSVSRASLKSRLAKAVGRSQTVVFFESYLDAVNRADDGFWSFKWQFFELLHAREALFVSLDHGLCRRWILKPGERVSLGDCLFSFSGLSDLSARLELRDWSASQ